MYLSRLAAQKEWAFLKVCLLPRISVGVAVLISWQVLHEHQFPVPRPVDQARHCILMEFIDAYPL
jgi:RIO kinase 2